MTGTQLKIDESLIPLLEVSDESESQRLITQIISEHARPVIRNIIKYKLRLSPQAENYGRDNPDAEDIYNEVVVQLLARLKEFRADPRGKAIGQLRSYVAVITYHSCYRYLRQLYPQRHILKNRLRYLLSHQAGFSIWEGAHQETMCGFAAWREGRSAAQTAKVLKLSHDPNVLAQAGLLASDAQHAKPAEAVAAVFTYLEGPLELDELVKIMARLWGAKDERTVSRTELDEEFADGAGALPDIGADLDRRDYLQKLWREVCELPLRQRAALLLNLREEEGRGCIELFQLAGVATIEQIAEALEIPTEQFASLWNELPLDDLAIAARLGLERQQVINLRKSARARLARRMKIFE